MITHRRLAFIGVLMAALIAFGGALWLTRAPKTIAPAAVSSIPVPRIHHVTIQTRDAVVELARPGDGDVNGGQWQLETPVSARADADRVSTLLQLAARIPQRRLAPDAVDDATTGLDDPALVVRFNDEAPIAIGGEGPLPGTRYVRTAHALLVVSARTLGDLPPGWTHWLSPSPIAADAALGRITLPRLTLTRSDNGGWQVAPIDADRGADYAQATVDAWHQSRAFAVEPADASRARESRITLVFVDGHKQQLDVIARSPELILRNTDLGVDYILAASRAGPLLDMHHPDLLRQSRADHLRASAIPLVAPDTHTDAARENESGLSDNKQD